MTAEDRQPQRIPLVAGARIKRHRGWWVAVGIQGEFWGNTYRSMRDIHEKWPKFAQKGGKTATSL